MKNNGFAMAYLGVNKAENGGITQRNGQVLQLRRVTQNSQQKYARLRFENSLQRKEGSKKAEEKKIPRC